MRHTLTWDSEEPATVRASTEMLDLVELQAVADELITEGFRRARLENTAFVYRSIDRQQIADVPQARDLVAATRAFEFWGERVQAITELMKDPHWGHGDEGYTCACENTARQEECAKTCRHCSMREYERSDRVNHPNQIDSYPYKESNDVPQGTT